MYGILYFPESKSRFQERKSAYDDCAVSRAQSENAHKQEDRQADNIDRNLCWTWWCGNVEWYNYFESIASINYVDVIVVAFAVDVAPHLHLFINNNESHNHGEWAFIYL